MESGSDRVAEVAVQLSCDCVVNVQGDEPFVRGTDVDALVTELRSGAPMATLMTPIEDERELSAPLGVSEREQLGCPVTFDISHALQLPGALGTATGGRGEKAQALAWAGISQGLAGIFVEAHVDPKNAPCDGPCAIPLSEIDAPLRRAKVLDDLIKSAVFE